MPGMILTQFQGISGNGLAGFKSPDIEVVLLPGEFKSGALQLPYQAGRP